MDQTGAKPELFRSTVKNKPISRTLEENFLKRVDLSRYPEQVRAVIGPAVSRALCHQSTRNISCVAHAHLVFVCTQIELTPGQQNVIADLCTVRILEFN
jgi:hypothetical protein